MGYNTDFVGELKFTKELTASQLAKLNTFLDEDCRNHPEWGNTSISYIDLELLDDFSGIRWNGNEKTYDLTEKVNLIIKNMREDYPDFGLSGQLSAQGEEFDDRWALVIEGDIAIEKKIALQGTKVCCPHCEEEFLLEETED